MRSRAESVDQEISVVEYAKAGGLFGRHEGCVAIMVKRYQHICSLLARAIQQLGVLLLHQFGRARASRTTARVAGFQHRIDKLEPGNCCE